MFYENFSNLCHAKGVSANAVAKALSLSSATVTKWKKGSVPNNKTLKLLADYFGVTPEYLLHGDSAAAPFAPQQKKLAGLIAQLDERDQIKLEGIIEEMLRADKYQKSASKGA